MTDDIFRKLGHWPLENDILNMLERGIAMDFFISLIICCGTLFGPVPLLVSMLEMMSSISIGDVGFSMNEFAFGFFR